jgi:hypothetical protein
MNRVGIRHDAFVTAIEAGKTSLIAWDKPTAADAVEWQRGRHLINVGLL